MLYYEVLAPLLHGDGVLSFGADSDFADHVESRHGQHRRSTEYGQRSCGSPTWVVKIGYTHYTHLLVCCLCNLSDCSILCQTAFPGREADELN